MQITDYEPAIIKELAYVLEEVLASRTARYDLLTRFTEMTRQSYIHVMKSKAMDVTLIGPGAVGAPLVRALASAGYPIRSVVTRKKPEYHESLRNGLKLPGDSVIVPPDKLNSSCLGNLVFITVPDDQIQPVAVELAAIPVDWNGCVAGHCSGFHHSGLLDPLKAKGVDVAAFHPVQTFAGGDREHIFRDIHISIEGDPGAIRVLKAVGTDIGANPFEITREQKNALHVAAVFLSNYLVVLGHIADRLVREAIPGMNMHLLRPLLEKTAENLNRDRPDNVLTGPVSRGDIKTVKQHLELLSEQPDLADLYKVLGQQALGMMKGDSRIDSQMAEAMEELFNKDV